MRQPYSIKLNRGWTLCPATDFGDLIDYCPGHPPAERCPRCHGAGSLEYGARCASCNGVGFLRIDPRLPCRAIQGSQFKHAMLAARYRAKVPLWNPQDARG